MNSEALTPAALDEVEDVAELLAAEDAAAEETALLPELLAMLEDAVEVEDCCGVTVAELLLSVLPPPPPPQANSEIDMAVDNSVIHSVWLLLMMLPPLFDPPSQPGMNIYFG